MLLPRCDLAADSTTVQTAVAAENDAAVLLGHRYLYDVSGISGFCDLTVYFCTEICFLNYLFSLSFSYLLTYIS